MRYEVLEAANKPCFPNFHFFDAKGDYVFVSSGLNKDQIGCKPGKYESRCIIPANLLNDGVYFVGIALTFTHCGMHVSFFERDALSFVVRDPIEETLAESRNGYSGPIPGPVRPRLEWHIYSI
jgi:lipopolysaccharide transport system ATP-binding protein